MFLKKFKIFTFSKARLEAFSDAVFAIVMTLLVLELKIPHLTDAANADEVMEKLKEVLPVFYSWAVSFFFVGVIWLHHQSILSMATKTDYGSAWINMFLLFFICLLPFPTALMGEYPHQALFVTFWGLTVMATTICVSWFYYYHSANYLSLRYRKKMVMRNVRLSLMVPAIYLVGSFLSWCSVYVSFVIFALVPLLFLLPLDTQISLNDNGSRSNGDTL